MPPYGWQSPSKWTAEPCPAPDRTPWTPGRRTGHSMVPVRINNWTLSSLWNDVLLVDYCYFCRDCYWMIWCHGDRSHGNWIVSIVQSRIRWRMMLPLLATVTGPFWWPRTLREHLKRNKTMLLSWNNQNNLEMNNILCWTTTNGDIGLLFEYFHLLIAAHILNNSREECENTHRCCKVEKNINRW